MLLMDSIGNNISYQYRFKGLHKISYKMKIITHALIGCGYVCITLCEHGKHVYLKLNKFFIENV